MSIYPKYITVEKIAKMLNLRTERVLQKIEKMQLKLTKSNKLNREDVTQLVNSFLYSKKTSTQTKRNAAQLLEKLNNRELVSADSTPEFMDLIDESNKMGSNNSKQTKQTWYKIMVNFVADFVQVLFTPFLKTLNILLQRSVQFLETEHFKFVALIVAILVQMNHSANWYLRITPEENTSLLIAYGYAFMVDLFILVVTLEGRLSIAKTFASLTFLSNILYFQFWVGFSSTPQAYTNAISSLLISGIMAYIIYAYSELFVKYRQVN